MGKGGGGEYLSDLAAGAITAVDNVLTHELQDGLSALKLILRGAHHEGQSTSGSTYTERRECDEKKEEKEKGGGRK